MDILVNPSKEIFITKEQFENFSYYDLACFWCNWKLAFCFDDNGDIRVYTHSEDFAIDVAGIIDLKGLIGT